MLPKNFKFPKLYLEMDNLGWFNICNNAKGDYLWINDMEWYNCNQIQNYNYEDGELPNIILFAHTSGGDKWVWYYTDSSDDLLVGMCYHDDTEGVFYAKNIEHALFRNMLEFLSNSYFYIDKTNAKSYQFDIFETRKYLMDWRNRFDKWFENDWLQELDNFLKLDFKLCSTQYGSYYALLTPEEVTQKIKKYLDFDLNNTSFTWSK